MERILRMPSALYHGVPAMSSAIFRFSRLVYFDPRPNRALLDTVILAAGTRVGILDTSLFHSARAHRRPLEFRPSA